MLISSVKRSQMFVLVVLQHFALNPVMVYTWAAAGIYLYGSLKIV